MSNTEHGKFLMNAADSSQPNQTTNGTDTPHSVQNNSAIQQQPTDTAEGGQGAGRVDEVYNELIHMRKMNRVLGQRIKQLEV